jgi:signal peptidase
MAGGTAQLGRDWLPSAPAAAPVALVPTPRRPLDDPSPPRQPATEPRRSTGSRVILGTLLNLAALLGMAMTGVTAYAATHGMHPLVVRSGSMEPLVHTGSMVLVRTVPAAQVHVGDVVAVKRPDGVTVTHRVVSMTRSGPFAELILKGDANQAVDPAPVTITSAGRLVWTAPLLGRAAAWTASARGGFLLGCVVTGCLLSVRRRSS